MHTDSPQSPPYLQVICPEDEDGYRCAFLRGDARVLAGLIGCGVLLVWSDLRLWQPPVFSWVLISCFGFSVLSLVTIIAVLRTGSPHRLDQWSLAWAMTAAVLSVVINSTLLPFSVGHLLFALCVVMAFYILQAGPTLWRVLPPLLLSLCHMELLLGDSAPDVTTTIATIIAFLAANSVGWLVASNRDNHRRSSYQARKSLERLYRQSEQWRETAEASERLWVRLVDTSPNMAVVIDVGHRLFRVNKAFADRLGISKEAAIGRNCCEILCRCPPKPTFCPLMGICTTRRQHRVETFMTSLGADVSIVAAPLLDQSGAHEATVLIITDITDWKRSELALKTAREQYRSLVENSHGIIYTITPEGKVTYISPRFHTLLGFAPETVLGKHFSEIVHPEDVPLCEAFQQELLASGAARHGLEYRIIHEDGSVRWHLSNFIPRLDGRGQVESYVGNAMDITEQKRFQVELKQAREAAEAASQAKSDFLALISHEIRTPLNAIVGFGGLARRTADPSQLRTYIDILDQSAHLLMDLVNDVLDMSKAEAGQLTIDAIPFNLPETLELLLWQFIPIVAKNPRVDVNLCKDDNLPIWIVGDPTRFRQIVSNLLSNALKFTEIGSVILNVRLRATEKGDNGEGLLVVEVRDTGIGIDEDKQTLLFQPFQQLQPGITRKYGGTGLGLTIVRRLVELMGGQITVVSRLGHGSTFTVELPCHPCAPPQYEQLHAAPGGALSVLVVEDNTFNRMLLQETLSAWGYTVTSVANAPDALELMDAHRYDCIILDVWMPGLDGLELALRLRRLEVLSHVEGTPIIAYTADTDERTRQKCRDAGIQAVLFKPLDPQQLALVMNELCSPVGSQAGAKGGGQDDDRQLAHRGLNEQIIDDLEHNPERITTYARLLWEDIDHELNRLDQALQREDRRQIQEASHGLKGLGGYLRDQRGGQLALRLHRAALDHPFPELSELVQQLRQVCIRPSDLF